MIASRERPRRAEREPEIEAVNEAAAGLPAADPAPLPDPARPPEPVRLPEPVRQVGWLAGPQHLERGALPLADRQLVQVSLGRRR